MNKPYQVLAFASLTLLAACFSRPQLTHADPEPITVVIPTETQVVGSDIRSALAEYEWKTLSDEPGHMVVQRSRQTFGISIKLDIRYTSSEVVIKFLELVSLDGEPIDQLQIGHYHRWTGNLRKSIADNINATFNGPTPTVK